MTADNEVKMDSIRQVSHQTDWVNVPNSCALGSENDLYFIDICCVSASDLTWTINLPIGTFDVGHTVGDMILTGPTVVADIGWNRFLGRDGAIPRAL